MSRINAKTQIAALIGNPVEHSLSPEMHNAAFEKLGINCKYVAFKVNNLGKAVAAISELNFLGLNVTMPFKAEIIPLLDKVDATAKKIGAVNTIAVKNGKLIGYNTDGVGAVASLKEKTKLKGKKAILIGAGGAGKSIAFMLKKEKAHLTIADRNSGKARKLAKLIGCRYTSMETLSGLKPDILINATPMGMKPNEKKLPVPKEMLIKGLVVFDIVYDPVETKLLKLAKKKGCKTINGIEMLINQGVESFGLWTGRKAPKEVMRKAVLNALGKG
ncbi:MAG: shikimate dehydrogenase [Candidatus Diapherotrites archaeon]